METKHTSISDIPLNEEPDAIGIQQYTHGLIRFIDHSTTPITIALQGEWGSGKTSLMNKLFNCLCGPEGHFEGITINTWEFSMMSTPEETVLRIIEYLVKKLSEYDNSHSTLKKFKSWARIGGGVAFRAAREATKIIGGVAGSLLVEGLVNGGPDSNVKSEDVALSDLKASLEQSVDLYVQNGKHGIIIFVDDLDRLNPSVAVEILELLKNIFTLKNCIFILAIDYEVVVKGLQPKFGNLTSQNEREFRSFFDKIIQVPFSLPVNNYRPENFILSKLLEIGYLTLADLNNRDYLSELLSEITNKTVGKNPRAIKRLINSLSLINCISSVCKDTSDCTDDTYNSIKGKIINFAIIALQISYPSIYDMFVVEPDLAKWDISLVRRFNIKDELNNEGNTVEWSDILSLVCMRDPYLDRHENDIKDVLEIITNLTMDLTDGKDIRTILTSFIDKSAVTGVGLTSKSSTEINYSSIIRRLHDNVMRELNLRHPDWKVTARRVTNSGGFNLSPIDKTIQTTISPHNVKDNKISFKIKLPMEISTSNFENIERLIHIGHSQALQDPKFMRLVNDFDAVISPLLSEEWFSGIKLIEYYNTRWQKNGNWLNPKRILFIPEYIVSLPFAEGFESKEIIKAITDIHEALWNVYLDAKHL